MLSTRGAEAGQDRSRDPDWSNVPSEAEKRQDSSAGLGVAYPTGEPVNRRYPPGRDRSAAGSSDAKAA